MSCPCCLPEGTQYYANAHPARFYHAMPSQEDIRQMIRAKWDRWYSHTDGIQMQQSWMGVDDICYTGYTKVLLSDLATRPHVLQYWDGGPSVVWLDGMHTPVHPYGQRVVLFEEIKAR